MDGDYDLLRLYIRRGEKLNVGPTQDEEKLAFLRKGYKTLTKKKLSWVNHPHPNTHTHT